MMSCFVFSPSPWIKCHLASIAFSLDGTPRGFPGLIFATPVSELGLDLLPGGPVRSTAGSQKEKTSFGPRGPGTIRGGMHRWRGRNNDTKKGRKISLGQTKIQHMQQHVTTSPLMSRHTNGREHHFWTTDNLGASEPES